MNLFLFFRNNSNESEDKNNDKIKEINDENNSQSMANNMENSMDLSVKKSIDKIDNKSETEPMDITLDLSMPSSSINSKQTSNGGQNQQLATNWSNSSSPDVQMTDTENVGSSQMMNGINSNGYSASDDSTSRADVEEETELPPSLQTRQLSVDELKAKQKRMRRLKQELRNEEMKLILLKKLRQSQLMKENIVSNLSQTPTNPTTTPVVNHSMIKTVNNMSSRNGSIGSSPQSSVLNVSHNRSAIHNSKGHSVLNPPFGRNQSLSHGPIVSAPLGMGQRNNSSNHMPSAAHSQSLRPGPLSSMNRTPVTTPPNVVLGYPVQDLRAQQNSNYNSILNTHQSVSNCLNRIQSKFDLI